MKIDRHGKASIFEKEDIKKIRKVFDVNAHRAIFEIALLTGERIGAVIQLNVRDVYDASGGVRQAITFEKSTRKGKTETRQVDVHPDLAGYLANYEHPTEGYLFPGRSGHITYNGVLDYWKRKFKECGIDNKGFTPHSPRRWFITQLVRNGVDIATVQAITGHKNVTILLGYVADNATVRKNAIANVQAA